MGFFSRTKITSSQQHDFSSHQQYFQNQQQFIHVPPKSQRRKVSFTDPPNVYLPPIQDRPQRSRPYNAAHNHSQPNFIPAGYVSQPPPPLPNIDWTSPPGMIMNAGVNSMQQMASTTCTKIAETFSAYDDMYRRFDDVMTMIDCENFKGHELGLFSCDSQSSDTHRHKSRREQPESTRRPRRSKSVDDMQERALFKPSKRAKETAVKKDHIGEKHKQSSGTAVDDKKGDKDKDRGQSANTAANIVAGTYFSKVECYSNAKLSADLPPLALYMSTWPLLCLAAKFSQSVYERPRGPEREAHVPSDWRSGTKAMRIKSVPMDSMNTIVFAIRGTASFMDWAVNLNSVPVSPQGFLDDPGNLCHQGFLSTARSMVAPVARRLADLLEENPNRSKYSLMITGHSAGGAVAALLYCHMLAREREAHSELNAMTNRFKRVHCVTFGAPPISLLPLVKPSRLELRKSIFMSFINEGDPVARAEKPYVKSLLELLASPAPPPLRKKSKEEDASDQRKTDKERKERSKTDITDRRILRPEPSRSKLKHVSNSSLLTKPTWRVPEATLSNAGRLVILRTGTPGAKAKDRKTVAERLNEGVLAVTCKEEQLRGCVFGDPVAHMMALYAGRIEMLAVGAVTGRNG